MNKFLTSLLVGLLLCLGGAGVYWFLRPSGPIVPYDASRDRAFILDTFNKNWYWLISDYSPDFNVGFLLDHKSPKAKDMSDAGILIIKTYVEQGKPIGFVMYYPKELKVGQLLFLGVSEAFRRKGIARKLAVYALEDMKRMGMLGVKLTARTDNTRARSLYESLGFKQIWTDGAYVIYEKIF